MRIFIVDDNEEFINVTISLLQKFEYQVIGFSDPEKFLNEIEIQPQDFLFLDIKMPQCDGISILKKLSNFPDSPKIVLMSGYDDAVLHSAAHYGRDLQLNIIDVLAKPFNYKAILKILESHAHVSFARKRLFKDLGNDFIISEIDIKHAFSEQQLVLFYQPQVDISSGVVIGFESLIRWNHPLHGLLMPDCFLYIMQSMDRLFELFVWILKELENHITLITSLIGKKKISINIVSSTLINPNFMVVLESFIKKSKLDASLLTIELIESEFIYNSNIVLDILLQLRLLGVKLSIDDFGTGYSSLTLLHKMPFTELKIDKSFVLRVCDDIDSRKIVKSCIALANQLNLDVIDEGVENQDILDYLRLENCQIAQGYFIAKPMEIQKLISWSTDYTDELLN